MKPKKPNKTAIEVKRSGSIFLFEPLTQRAEDWIENNVQSEVWQWLGRKLAVERACALDLASGMLAAGLKVA